MITGHLIPAGTGLREFSKLVVGSKEDFDMLRNREVVDYVEEEA